jgi:hypothetical protein
MDSKEAIIILVIAAIINLPVMYYLVRSATDADKHTTLLHKQLRLLKLIAAQGGASEQQIKDAIDLTKK